MKIVTRSPTKLVLQQPNRVWYFPIWLCFFLSSAFACWYFSFSPDLRVCTAYESGGRCSTYQAVPFQNRLIPFSLFLLETLIMGIGLYFSATTRHTDFEIDSQSHIVTGARLTIFGRIVRRTDMFDQILISRARNRTAGPTLSFWFLANGKIVRTFFFSERQPETGLTQQIREFIGPDYVADGFPSMKLLSGYLRDSLLRMGLVLWRPITYPLFYVVVFIDDLAYELAYALDKTFHTNFTKPKITVEEVETLISSSLPTGSSSAAILTFLDLHKFHYRPMSDKIQYNSIESQSPKLAGKKDVIRKAIVAWISNAATELFATWDLNIVFYLDEAETLVECIVSWAGNGL